MRIAVEIHGTITHGLWTPERGESRWAQNTAAILGRAGHEVLAFGFNQGVNRGWGLCPPQPNVELIEWSKLKGQKVDYLFDSAWWDGKQAIVDAGQVLRGYFSYQPYIGEAWPENHRLVYPYFHTAANLNVPQNQNWARARCLPYPMLQLPFWGDFQAAEPKTDLLWINKGPFSESIDRPSSVWGGHMLTLAEELRTRTLWVLADDQIEPSFSEATAYYQALPRLFALPLAKICGLVPLAHAVRLMQRSVLALNLPRWNSWHLEAANEGCVPLCWKSDPVLLGPTQDLDPSLVLDDNKPDLGHLREVAKRILADQNLRIELLFRYLKALEGYNEASVLTHWERLLAD